MVLIMAFVFPQHDAACQAIKLDSGWYHLRNADPREWAEFPEKADKQKLTLRFSADPGGERTLSLRQYDIKQDWKILLNGEPLGALVRDEKDLIAYFPIGAAMIKSENTLEIACADTKPDDIRIGKISLHDGPIDRVLAEARMAIAVFDIDTKEKIPARITIVNEEGALQSISAFIQKDLPVRPGYAYTSNGTASICIPAGNYTIYANRGFEYGVDSVQVALKPGNVVSHNFFLKREVATPGWASCDTHIHTYTWSGHGDATTTERVLTIAGENIELPVLTDHNVQKDLKPFAIEQRVLQYFTPVTGNEVTTAVGHFNVFPLSAGEVVINHRGRDWKTIKQNIAEAGNSQAIIMNHGRDIHSRFRPLDPALHLSTAGMRLDDAPFFFNAMEVVNSGAQKTDQLQLIRDWFGILNHGQFITPVGSSDSHDVSRYFVGQARTYIRCNDDDPADIDLNEVVKNFREGNVMVSFGLLAEIEINDAYGPGELVPATDKVKVSVKVSGPSWTRATRIELYANGLKIREEKIDDGNTAGVKWNGTWNLTLPPQDVFLVALAVGPGDYKPFWPIAKPYQPDTPEWKPQTLGLSGAAWVDADKNGIRNCAKDYAERIYSQAGTHIDDFIQSLADFDEAVSIQAAAILHQKGKDLSGQEVTNALRRAAPQTKSGFEKIIAQLKESRD